MPDSTGVKRVLVVDDNQVIRDVLHEFLSPLYHVDTAADAAQALQALIDHPPDLILLDVRIPGTDGMTLLKSLRNRGVTTPIIIITGYQSPQGAEEAAQYGVSGYLAKPFDLRQLDRLIADTIHRRGPRTD